MTDARTLTLGLGGKWLGCYGTAPCPVCQPEHRRDQDALTLADAPDGRLLAHCKKAGCEFRDILAAAGIHPGNFLRPDPVAAREAEVKRSEYDAAQLTKARRLWGQSKPINGTKGEAYLRARGITCPLPHSLRWAADAFHGPSGRWLSTMVADVSTGGVHRTFFEKAGERISGNAKMMQGPCAGGAVALSEAQGQLVVCEGLETGLSLLCGLLDAPATVWATLSTSGMRALHLPDQPGRLVVAADGDNPGRAAAYTLAERAHALGWQVSLLPAPNGRDWNDILNLKGAEHGL